MFGEDTTFCHPSPISVAIPNHSVSHCRVTDESHLASNHIPDASTGRRTQQAFKAPAALTNPSIHPLTIILWLRQATPKRQ